MNHFDENPSVLPIQVKHLHSRMQPIQELGVAFIVNVQKRFKSGKIQSIYQQENNLFHPPGHKVIDKKTDFNAFFFHDIGLLSGKRIGRVDAALTQSMQAKNHTQQAETPTLRAQLVRSLPLHNDLPPPEHLNSPGAASGRQRLR